MARGIAAGLPLREGAQLPWLSGRGHLELGAQETPAAILARLATIHAELGGDATLLTQIAQIRRHVDDGESAPRLFLGFDDDEECAALDRRLGGKEVAEGSER